ncbi:MULTISPECIES: GMC family oxidoreductase [Methylobacterium]|uniref:2-methyl-1,2-propanediol dehydrogenase n=1 Tax=Methylobacterium thuringiense TaxID=1003091 RepID=A0ABQ4TLH4_9HYPH|nr:GMC family oxidoreductase [Methylobacterium thuringiense]TXN19967.1 hypothetical protein FV217_19630 [Methylobacterium sp. WL9]GJE55841.1 2-methyl-1,2-propanediol dehydrogenase [Methylobacterium thuringiense]
MSRCIAWCDDDGALNRHGIDVMGLALAASGGRNIGEQGDDTHHRYGIARMGDHPKTPVVDGDCRSWDSPNLWVCDGSVVLITGGVNPSLTIQAIALRTADRITAMVQGRDPPRG